MGLYIPSNSSYSIYRDNLDIGPINTVSIALNRWFHLAYSIERIPGTGLIVKTYFDGALIATDEIALPDYHFKVLTIGAASQYPWPGYIKNAFVSEGALSDEEVRLMMLYEQVSDKSTRIPTVDMALTFRIKPYVSLEQLALDTPEHGTIGLVTESEVPRHIFSASEPLLPDEGTVWIQTGTDSNVCFFASQEDAMQVCPVLAKQYLEGTWKTIPAKTYLDGQWETWRLPLYDTGDEFKAWSGGWVTGEMKLDTGVNTVLPSITRSIDSARISISAYKSGIAYCAEPVDLTGHSTLRFEGVMSPKDTSLGYWTKLVVLTGTGGSLNDTCVAYCDGPLDGASEIDISALEGPHYIGFMLYATGSAVTMRKLYIQ